MSERKTEDKLDFIPVFDDEMDLVFEEANNDDNDKVKPLPSNNKLEDRTQDDNDDDDLPELPVNPNLNPNKDKPITEEDEDTAVLNATVNTLRQKGILGTDEISSWEELDEQMSHLPKNIENSIVESMPPIVKKLMEFSLASGSNLTKEELASFFNQYNAELSETPREFNTIDSARNYLDSYYKGQNIKEIARSAMLDALEDEEDAGAALISEAKRIQDAILKRPKKTDKLIEEKKSISYEEELRQNRFKKNVIKELEETGWKKERVNKVQSMLASGGIRDVLSLAGNSPKALIQLADLATYYDKETGEFNFEDFIKQLASKEVDNIKKNITKDNFTSISSKSNGKKLRKSGGKSLFETFTPI